MKVKVSYIGAIERKAKVLEHEVQGLRMVSDTFVPGWKPGQEPSGEMVFTDAPANIALATDYKALYAAAATDAERLNVLAKAAGLK